MPCRTHQRAASALSRPEHSLLACEALKFSGAPPIGKTGVINTVKISRVEDSRRLRLENERALRRVGDEGICAEDGAEALERAREEFPDAILLDLLLPRISGLEVLRRLRRMAETADIPIVVVSGPSGKNRAQLIEEGADDYLEKNPILPDKGVNVLPKVLQDVMRGIGRKHGQNVKPTPTLK